MCCSRACTWTPDCFNELVSGKHFPWCMRQSTVAFRSISHIVHVMFLPEQFALRNLGALSRPLRWLYSFWAMPGRTVDLSVASGRIFGIFSVKESSDPAVDSRPALLGIFASCSMEKCAQSMLRCTWNLDIMFTSSLHLTFTWPLFQDCMKRIRGGPVHRHWPMHQGRHRNSHNNQAQTGLR